MISPAVADRDEGSNGASPLTAEDAQRVAEVLRGEYGLLMSALAANWSVGMARTSLLLGVLSATSVALGFVAQGTGFGSEFYLFASVLLPVTLFLGLATFVRVVQIQREGVVCVIGMNRIRAFVQEQVPASKPYFVFSAHDDPLSLYRNLGTGVTRRPPRFRLLYALVQVPGVVAVVDAVIAGAIAGIAVAWVELPGPVALGAASVVFVLAVAGLLAYWDRQMDELTASIAVTRPTSPDDVQRPI